MDSLGRFKEVSYLENTNEGFFFRSLTQLSKDVREKLETLPHLSKESKTLITTLPSQFSQSVENSQNHFLKNKTLIPFLPLIRSVVYGSDDQQRRLKEKINIAFKNDSLNKKFCDLQIHHCPSLEREVEILKNNLLSLLEVHPEIALNEILIMAPNIEVYLPYIDRVFSETPSLKYSMTDQILKSDLKLYQALQKLLLLLTSRFEAGNLFSILENPLIQESWGWTQEDVREIKNWLSHTGYRWGRDQQETPSKSSSPSNPSSLRQSLNHLSRFFFNGGMDLNTKEVGKNIFIFPVGQEKEAIFGKLLAFTESLFYFDQRLRSSASLTVWIKEIKQLLEVFFFRKISSEGSEKQTLIEQLNHLEESVSINGDFRGGVKPSLGFSKKMDLKTFLWILEQEFSESNPNGYLMGGITFASMKPMRALPFKVVALLGMGEAFPSHDSFQSYNLMKNYKPGDRSKKKDDELFFLETILSCEVFLHLSYQGQSLENQMELPSSILVSNLLLSLASILKWEPELLKKLLTLKHPLRGSDKEAFMTKENFFIKNFSEKDFDLALAQKSTNPSKSSPNFSWQNSLLHYFKNQENKKQKKKTETMDRILENFLAHIKSKNSNPQLGKGKSSKNLLKNNKNLKKFFKHPCKFFVSSILSLELSSEKDLIEETEKFFFSSLDQYHFFRSVAYPSPSGSDINSIDSYSISQQKIVASLLSEESTEKLKEQIKYFFKQMNNLMTAVDTSSNKIEINDNEKIDGVKNFSRYPYHLDHNTSLEKLDDKKNFLDNWEIWNFDLDQNRLTNLSYSHHYFFVSIDGIYQGYRIYTRYFTLKLYDLVYCWIDHLLLSFVSGFKGSILPLHLGKHNTKEEIFIPVVPSHKRLPLLMKIGKLFYIGQQVPLPLNLENKLDPTDKLSKALLDQIRKKNQEGEPNTNDDWEKIKSTILDNKEWMKDQWESYCFPENFPQENFDWMIDFYIYLFAPIIEISELLTTETLYQHLKKLRS